MRFFRETVTYVGSRILPLARIEVCDIQKNIYFVPLVKVMLTFTLQYTKSVVVLLGYEMQDALILIVLSASRLDEKGLVLHQSD